MLLLPLGVAALLAACSPDHDPTPDSQPPAPKAAKADNGAGTPLDGLLQDRQRARDVQKTVNAHAHAQDAAIEAQSQ
ncbi:hypothetical protein HBF24_14965 [Oleiagrimonas sp. C23AA]|nr:hypothetical protein [Oleiagrimonas sp. C23AA]